MATRLTSALSLGRVLAVGCAGPGADPVGEEVPGAFVRNRRERRIEAAHAGERRSALRIEEASLPLLTRRGRSASSPASGVRRASAGRHPRPRHPPPRG